MMIDELTLTIPRYAFTPRHVARAGAIWRLFQTAAVTASTRHGWSPARYRAASTSFIVSRMTVRHHRELATEEPPTAATWVRDFRRGIISHRQIRLLGGGTPVATTTQQWVHISSDTMRPARAGPEMLAAFQPVERTDAPITLPEVTPTAGPTWTLGFRCWHSWMDVLGHVNHPTYIDWCDEALLQRTAERGGDPNQLVPVAEEVRFRRGVVAGQDVVVESQLIGTADDAAAFTHTITADGLVAATATTLRRLTEGSLAALLA